MSAGLTYSAADSTPAPPWVPDLDSSNSSWELVESEAKEACGKNSPVKRVPQIKTGKECKEQSFVFDLDLPEAESSALLRASTLTQLGAFNFDQLRDLYLDPELVAGSGEISIRLSRAVRAGLSARQKLRGEVFGVVKSPSLSRYSTTRWYICLRSPLCPSGFVTSNYRTYCARTCHPKSTKFIPEGVHHSFDSLAEVTAYLAGAKVQWPRELA